MRKVNTVLTIAGSDSSGGAGIQADIKTISAHGLLGTSVVTSITSQNSYGVQATHNLNPEHIESQLKAIFEDLKPLAVKTGMLGAEGIVKVVSKYLKKYKVKNLVVDPILLSTNGYPLLSNEGIRVMENLLFPLAKLVTPNLSEAEKLSGVRIKKSSDRVKAARAILKKGAQGVLIKGGHAMDNADDFFFDGKNKVVFPGKRFPLENLHGTGCVLSAAIASRLAKGEAIIEAIQEAKNFIGVAISQGIFPGKGAGCVDPMGKYYLKQLREDLIQQVTKLVETLKSYPLGYLIPEVQSNIGVGLSEAFTPDDVVAIPGRIVKKGKEIATIASPEFGASQHVAKIVLTVMRADATKRAVMNIKFTESLLKICNKLGFKISSFSRYKEPKNIKQLEGSSLEWGTYQAISDFGGVPDIIFDVGGQGKEEMIRVIAKNPLDLQKKILKIHRLAMKELPDKEIDIWRKK